MKRASEVVSNEQRLQVEAAVKEAESRTSCEIVPVVAASSGRYDRPEDIVGLWLATIAAVTVWLLFPRQLDDLGNWDGSSLLVGLLAMIVSVVLAFVTGAVAAGRIDPLRRIFTPRTQQQEEVASRAREVFFDRRVHHTAGGTGLLIYVSLFEQVAVVLGDQTVMEKLGQPAIDELCSRLTDELGSGDVASALCRVIDDAGVRLADVLPQEEGDVNEIHDTLILID